MIDTKKFPKVWEKVRRFWNYPRLNSPDLLNEEEAAAVGMSDEIAAIDMGNNRIKINKKNLEDRLGEEFAPAVTNHEVGHYKFMPYNLRNLVRMVGYADKVMRNIKQAKLVENQYADLCVNTKTYQKGDHSVVDLYKKMSEGNNSELWQLYMTTYENMIGCQGLIIPRAEEEIRTKAKKLADVVGSAMDKPSDWPDSITSFAKTIKDYMRKEEEARKQANNSKSGNSNQDQDNSPENGDGQPDNSPAQTNDQPGEEQGDNPDGNGQSGPGDIPDGSGNANDQQPAPPKPIDTPKPDKPPKDDPVSQPEYNPKPDIPKQDPPDITKGLIDNHDAKDFLPFDPDKTPDDVMSKKIESELDGLGKELGEDEFKRVVSGLGIGSRAQANKWLYKELSKEYTLFLPNLPTTNSGDFKETPVKWTLEDSFEELDMIYTLRQSPIVIPNATTYKWKKSNGESYGLSKSTPDLLIVLDSSISMPDPNDDLSFPVISAIVAAQTALSYGNKVAVINFSSDYKSCEFTNQSYVIDDLLMLYQNGGTTIPGDEMVRITSKHPYPIHTIIISDTDIQNLDEEIDNLEMTLKNSKAGGSIFLACKPDDKTKQIEDLGYDVHIAADFTDLGDLTIAKSKELYNPV